MNQRRPGRHMKGRSFHAAWEHIVDGEHRMVLKPRPERHVGEQYAVLMKHHVCMFD